MRVGETNSKHPGTWIDNVFYSDLLANRWLSSIISKVENQVPHATLPDPTTEIKNEPESGKPCY